MMNAEHKLVVSRKNSSEGLCVLSIEIIIVDFSLLVGDDEIC